MSEKKDPPKKNERWYLGGVAGCMALFFTHPFDLVKVHLQTQTAGKSSMSQMFVNVIKNEGFFKLYNGLSASMLRQISYTSTRFGLYGVFTEQYKQYSGSQQLPFYMKIAISSVSGFGAGIVGNPADMINVRMQNDMKLPKHLRRNYSNALHGLYTSAKGEGLAVWFNGATMTASRGLLMTVGQVAFYDQIKQMVLQEQLMQDNIYTHFFCSLLAGTIATALTQPFDVLKTRLMNAKKNEYRGLFDLVNATRKEGLMAFYKGFIPAWTRLGPQTILTFVFLEQLRVLCDKVEDGTLF